MGIREPVLQVRVRLMRVRVHVIDYLGTKWTLLCPGRYKTTLDGFVTMWVLVAKGPQSLRDYQEIPLPVFTEWWL